jgi:hypothetical protein
MLNAINPGLVSIAPSLSVQTTIAASATSPATTMGTSIKSQRDC